MKTDNKQFIVSNVFIEVYSERTIKDLLSIERLMKRQSNKDQMIVTINHTLRDFNLLFTAVIYFCKVSMLLKRSQCKAKEMRSQSERNPPRLYTIRVLQYYK